MGPLWIRVPGVENPGFELWVEFPGFNRLPMDKQSYRSDRPCSRIELVTAMVGIMTMGNVPS